MEAEPRARRDTNALARNDAEHMVHADRQGPSMMTRSPELRSATRFSR
jgi:hypothetical protein